jgi:hypothetical protein
MQLLHLRMQQVQQVKQEALRLQRGREEHAAATYQEQHRQWAAQQEQVVGKLVPELDDNYTDKAAMRSLQNAARDTLHEAGFTDRELAGAWNAGHPLLLRDARVQKVVADAARWRMAERARAGLANKRARGEVAPVLQPPGVATNVYDTGGVQQAFDRLKKSNSVHDAVAALQAKRAAARR